MPFADTASDMRVEFDRLNGSGGMDFRFAYHHGSTFIATDYRSITNWPAVVAAATDGFSAFGTYMTANYSPWWGNAPPGTAERLSLCNAVRQIVGLSVIP
jgi:hypothetical protein